MALLKQSRTVRLPVHLAKKLNLCLRARHKLEQQGMPEAGSKEIARLRGAPVEEVRQIILKTAVAPKIGE